MTVWSKSVRNFLNYLERRQVHK